MENNNNLEMNRSKARKLFGLGDFGFPSMTNVESQFWTFFMTDVAMVPLGLMAMIQTVTGFIEMVMAPLYGVILSATKPGKFGRYSTWMIICPPLIVGLYLFQWFALSDSGTVNGLIIAVGYTLSHLLWNAIWVANVSLLPILATNAEERVKLSSKRFAFNYAARFCAAFYLVPLLTFFTDTIGLKLAYGALALFTSLMMTAGYITVGRAASKVETALEEPAPTTGKRKVWGPMLKAFVGNPHLIALIVVDAARNVGSFVIGSFNMYYFNYCVGSMDFFSTNMLIGYLCGFSGAYISRFLVKIMPNRTACIVTALGTAGILACIMFFAPNSLVVYIVCYAIYQALTAAFQALLVPLYSECCTFAQWKTGVDNSGVIMGMQQFGVKLGAIFKGVAISTSLAAAGYVAGMDPTPALKAGICRGYFMFPGTAFIIGALALIFFYKLTPKGVEDMQKEIEERKSNA